MSDCYAPIRAAGLEVPETAVHLDDSPTRGEPNEGLPGLRSE